VDDATLARLGHLNLLAFCRESSLWSDAGQVVEAGGVQLYASGTDFPFLFNGAFRTDPTVPPDEVLGRADAFFGDLGRSYTLWGGPSDDDLVAAAEAAGFHPVDGGPEMVCRDRLEDVEPPEGVELRLVVDEAGVADFVSVGSAAYGTLGMPAEAMAAAITRYDRLLVPHLRTVVAYDDDRPVAAAQSVLSHGGAGVYWVATLEEARGKGLGEAVTRWVTNDAFDAGARFQSLQASRMGEPIYTRMGYETLYRYRNWIRPTS
jgi:GNAT superfamily N-acetyltransferase